MFADDQLFIIFSKMQSKLSCIFRHIYFCTAVHLHEYNAHSQFKACFFFCIFTQYVIADTIIQFIMETYDAGC